MQIKFDEKGHAVGFVELGGMEGATDFAGEIPEGFRDNCRMYRLINGELIFDEEKQAALIQAEANAQEMADIEAWFAWYDNQVCQYQRAQRLGEAFDRSIEELDGQAREKQLRLRELKGE